MDANALTRACNTTAQAAQEALAWVADPRNARKVAQQRPVLETTLRRVVTEARRLGQSVGRPNCVGVFGPSQAGKSYLISILARRAVAPLIATFAGDQPEIDFIRDINPVGGEESTGVVTRFTIHRRASPAGYPVCLRLLSQADIAKILINSFFQDGNQEYEEAPGHAELETHLAGFETKMAAAPVDAFADADVWDLREYVKRNAGGAASAQAVEPFWDRIANLAPRLSVPDRAELLSVLWGRHHAYTDLYRRLAAALARLGHPEEAFCAVEALIPSRDSIVNVNSLAALHEQGAAGLDVATADGVVVSLPRPVVTALTAELRIVCRDKPQPFFDHTDLLDFPGYRSRFSADLKRLFREGADTAPANAFLRGKVDYLFQRYTAELELTAMVLCVPDSNLEVTSLPKAVEAWVDVTHGSSPEKRLGKPDLLFFAMTKFDRTLEQKAGGEEGNLGEQLDARFRASLGPFAKLEPSWVNQWRPAEPFRNVFLVRNPNVRFMGVIEYDGAKETKINPAQAPRLEALKQAFAALPRARQHLADPLAAWSALMALNDGGAGRLAVALGQVCAPALKLGQIEARLREIRVEAASLLSRHHISDDLDKRRFERLAVVDDLIFPAIEEAADREMFGSALRGLMMDASDLYAALAEALNRAPEEAENLGRDKPSARMGGIFKKAAAALPTAQRPDRWAKLAGAALGAWATLLHARAADEAFSHRVFIGCASLKAIVAEFGEAARRTGLADRIAAELKGRAAAAEQNEAVVRRAALVAERLINRFVSEIDFDRLPAKDQAALFGPDLDEPVFVPRPVAYDAQGMAEERLDFTTNFVRQWGYAFRATVSANAMTNTGSLEEAQQNARLGGILQLLGA